MATRYFIHARYDGKMKEEMEVNDIDFARKVAINVVQKNHHVYGTETHFIPFSSIDLIRIVEEP